MDTHLVRLARLVSEVSGAVGREMVPEEAKEHFRTSAREALLGGKAILNSLIEQLDNSSHSMKEKTGSKRTTGSAVSVVIED
ncbi:hypothetical protein PAECIP111893_00526 [Paenibacillus plantiphilus]|uniref:Uncharacterized protein n=1 Tax=Paenibacillus plantiphilus TaxID=2905650 RepID=A0ABN8FWB0_9BACL|nr:hypothetical protein [Paenibacillus plantiphilus]CAH1193678.1 hypothetical protein PAECIP111893_00526 [Paenibacillus plantiphilus]